MLRVAQEYQCPVCEKAFVVTFDSPDIGGLTNPSFRDPSGIHSVEYTDWDFKQIRLVHSQGDA